MSWFGRVRVALPREPWPQQDGRPLLPLCQINCTELPFRPEALADIALLALFIHADELPVQLPAPNGASWLLRAYSALDDLVPLAEPTDRGFIRPFPIAWSLLEADYPCWEDVPAHIGGREYDTRYPNTHRSKVGGWPSWIQSGSTFDYAYLGVEYVLQIDSEEKAGWQWGDAGTGYVLRGVGERRREWYLDWQCY